MQTLPYDEAAENGVLGSVITNEGEYEIVSKYFTDTEVFYQKKAGLLWKKIKSMIRNKEKVDTLSVSMSVNKKDMQRGLTKHYVVTCTGGSCSKGMTEYHARTLYDKYLMRKIIIKADEIKTKAEDNTQDIYKTISETHSILSEILNTRPTIASDIDDIIADTVDSIKNKSTKLIKTGYLQLDKFAGGLTRGEITIIGGRPGHGKTTVMVNMLANVLEAGYKAIFFSRELPNAELLKKIICLESQQLSYSKVRKNVFEEQDLAFVNSTIAQIKSKYSKDKFLMFDNVKDFAASSSEVKKFKPDIIFDDYIQLRACEGWEDSRRIKIECVSDMVLYIS